MHLLTGILDQAPLAREVDHIVRFMAKHASSASYMFGVGSKVPIDDQWINFPIEVSQIGAKVEELVREGVFVFSYTDLYLYDGNDRFHFLLCHESDVHFESEAVELLDEIRSDWTERDFPMTEIKR